MATIDKISAILNTEIKMPFKIKARESVHTGNPFKDSSFDRLTLPADIFEGSEIKSQNRAKMILSSIAGHASNLKKNVCESVGAFCERIKNVSSSTWNYLRNTTVSEFGQSIGNSISEMGARAKDSIVGYGQNMKNSISERISALRNHNTAKISETMSVEELETLWTQELELMKGAA